MPAPSIHSSNSIASETHTPKPPGLSPSPQLQQQHPSINPATEADIQTKALVTEQPLFTEPNFNESNEIQKSPGTLSAEGADDAETMSPTEQ